MKQLCSMQALYASSMLLLVGCVPGRFRSADFEPSEQIGVSPSDERDAAVASSDASTDEPAPEERASAELGDDESSSDLFSEIGEVIEEDASDAGAGNPDEPDLDDSSLDASALSELSSEATASEVEDDGEDTHASPPDEHMAGDLPQVPSPHDAGETGAEHADAHAADDETASQTEVAEAGQVAPGGEVDGAACNGECECPLDRMGPRCEQLKFIDIAAGKSHTCGLLGDGSVRCWGSDTFQQISKAPTGDGYVAIQSGGVYSCAVRSDDTIYCWGNASDGILDVPLDPVLSLVTGWDAACVETSTGIYECWGSDSNGKRSSRPLDPVLELQIGWQQGCALLQDGSIQCWGENDAGQTEPPEGNDFVSLSLASWHGCAQREDGTVECWGSTSNAPSQPVTSISSRGLSTCAIMLDESVRCWGTGGALEPPSDISALKVAVGDGHSCALLTDNSITCWGQSPDGAAMPPSAP